MTASINHLDLAAARAQLASFNDQLARNGARWADQDVSESGLSQIANSAGRGMAELRIQVITDGGHPFPVLTEIATGNVVAVAPVETMYGWKWRVGGRFYAYNPKREATLGAHGFRQEMRYLPAEVGCTSTFVPMVRRAACTIEQANAARIA